MRVHNQVLKHGAFVASSLKGARLLAFCLLAFTSAASAQDTWLGSTGNWSQATQWSGGLPTSSSSVVIGGAVTLDLTPTTVNSLDLTFGGQLTLPGNSVSNQNAAVDLTISGAAIFDADTQVAVGAGSALTLNGDSSNSGTINLSSVTIVNGTAPYVGSLDGAGTLTNYGTIQGNNFSEGNTGGIIGINITNSASGVLTGDLTLNGVTVTGGTYGVNFGSGGNPLSNLTAFGATVNNVQFLGGVTLTGGSTLTAQGTLTNVELTLDAASVLNILSTTTVTSYALFNLAGGTLNNSGTLNETAKDLTNEGTFSNLGSLQAVGLFNSGSLNNSGAITTVPRSPTIQSDVENAGAFTNLVGGTINNTGTFANDAGATLTNSGAITDSGVMTNSGRIDNKGTFTEASFSYNYATFNNSGSLSVAGVFVSTLTATLNNTGTMVINSGGEFDNLASLLDNFEGAQITNNGTVDNTKFGTITNASTFTNNASLTNAEGTFTNSGVLNNPGSLENQSSMTIGGALNNSGGLSNISGGGFAVLAGGVLNNSGTLTSDFFSSFGTFANSSVVNTTTGTMSLSGNTVVIGGSLRNDGSITLVGGLLPGGDFPIIQPPPPLLVTSTGTLSGIGIVHGNVEMQGVMSPGDAPGTFTIDGNYSQDPAGTLDILLGGTGAGQFGVLDVYDTAFLDGIVDFRAVDGFKPEAGDDFTFLLFGDESSDFSKLVFANWVCPVGSTCTDVFAANSLTLEISGSPTTTTNSTPEPSSLLLLVAALIAISKVQRHRRSCRAHAAVLDSGISFEQRRNTT